MFVRVNYIYPYIFKCLLLLWTVMRFVLFFAVTRCVFSSCSRSTLKQSMRWRQLLTQPLSHMNASWYIVMLCVLSLPLVLSASLCIHFAVSSPALLQECVSSINKHYSLLATFVFSIHIYKMSAQSCPWMALIQMSHYHWAILLKFGPGGP